MAIDFTQWNTLGDYIPPQQVQDWLDAGVGKVIIGAGYAEPAIQQINACAFRGLDVELYRYLFWDRNITAQVDYAHGIMVNSNMKLGILWLDCEDDTGSLDESAIIGMIQQAVDTAGGFPVGIYTRRGWWVKATGNTTNFNNLPLWDANYDGLADLDNDIKGCPVPWKPYGGWQAREIKQYQGDAELSGRKVDLNIYKDM